MGATASVSRTLTATDVEALALAPGDVETFDHRLDAAPGAVVAGRPVFWRESGGPAWLVFASTVLATRAVARTASCSARFLPDDVVCG